MRENFNWRPIRQTVFDRVLVADFRLAVASMHEHRDAGTSLSIIGPHHLRRIREFISGPMSYSPCAPFNTYLLKDCSHLALLGRDEFLPSMRSLLCNDKLKSELDSKAPGLRSRIFHIATCVARVTVGEEGLLGMNHF